MHNVKNDSRAFHAVLYQTIELAHRIDWADLRDRLSERRLREAGLGQLLEKGHHPGSELGGHVLEIMIEACSGDEGHRQVPFMEGAVTRSTCGVARFIATGFYDITGVRLLVEFQCTALCLSSLPVIWTRELVEMALSLKVI